ncbi:glyoxalase superfamily protein [Thioclava sp.]|uniref:glyoxalase superfamily protein n=1 Tax=Thioclava sp. TaxID=1933450 RepID=UPI003AA929C6
MIGKDIKAAKAQAHRLADAMKRAGQPISLSRAYEIHAQASGHADWNTMAAGLRAPVGQGFALGDVVRGRYMGQPITGRVHALKRKGAEHVEIEIALDSPVDVVQSAAFSSLRRRVRATLGPDGRSVGRRSDGVAHLDLS